MTLYPTRSTKDYVLPALIVLAIGVVIILLFNLWGKLGEETGLGSLTTPVTATLSVTTGEAEAYLPASSAWKIVSSTATLSEGEKVRTGDKSVAKLAIDGGTLITLAPDSELEFTTLHSALGSKKLELAFTRGTILVDVRQTTATNLTLTNKLTKITDPAGALLLSTDALNSKLDVSVIVGDGATATILDPVEGSRKPELKNVIVDAGKTLSITERKINLLRIGGEIELVKPTTAEVTAGDFYVTYAKPLETVTATPAATPADTSTTPTATTPVATPTTTPVTPTTTTPATPATTPATPSGTLDAPKVTSHTDGSTVTVDPFEIKGTVSKEAVKITVAANGSTAYTLSKYVAGSGSFLYRAGTKFGNLKTGLNTYKITVEDKDGRSSSTSFTLNFAPVTTSSGTPPTTVAPSPTPTTPIVTIPASKDETASPAPTTSTISAPVVSSPADGTTITAGPVVLRGTVSSSTTAVEVNGYRLTKYVSGATSWYYTADTKYSNLKEGQNEYEITAVGANGEKASTTIKINYAPATPLPATTTP